MKTISAVILSAISASVFSSCSKDTAGQHPDETEAVHFTSSVMPETKTAFGEKSGSTYPVLWTKTHGVAVSYNSAPFQKAEIQEISENGKKADFSVRIAEDKNADSHSFLAFSPYSESMSIASGEVQFEIPSIQSPISGSCDESAQLIYAVATSSEFPDNVVLEFKHIAAYGKISLTLPEGAGKVSRIDLTANRKISGKAAYPLSGTGPLNAADDASNTVSILCDASTDVFFACFPEVLKGGALKVEVTAGDTKYTKMISFQMNSDFEFKAGTVSSFSVDLSECGETVKPYAYRTRQYGEKLWMVENCREAGEDGLLGQSWDIAKFSSSFSWSAGNDAQQKNAVAEINANAGRYYTWYEAMTGISNCTADQCVYKPGYSGKDDMGNAFVLDGTEANGEFNIQIKGCCPDGWHVANANDWWDLLHSIKVEYNITDDFAEGGFTFNGGHDGKPANAPTCATFYKNGCTVKNMGNVGAWLRGGNGRVSDGGVWNQASLTLTDAGTPLKQFVEGADEVGFGWFPAGRVKPNGSFNNGGGKYGYLWTPGQENAGFARSLCIAGTSMNLLMMNGTTREEANKLSRLNVRCVKNY